MMIRALGGEHSLEEAIITKTIMWGSSKLVPVKMLNGFFAQGGYVTFCPVNGFPSFLGVEENLSIFGGIPGLCGIFG